MKQVEISMVCDRCGTVESLGMFKANVQAEFVKVPRAWGEIRFREQMGPEPKPVYLNADLCPTCAKVVRDALGKPLTADEPEKEAA